MSAPFRHRLGGRIDRARPISFTFDGKTYQRLCRRYAGLGAIANGVHFVGRSYKYHRPRGILSAGADEPNALIEPPRGRRPLHAESARDPNPAVRRLVATSQNRWPSLQLRRRRDQRSASRRCSRPASTTRPSWGRTGSAELGLEERVRAVRAPRGGPRRRADASPTPTPTRSISNIAMCWSSAPAPPGSRRRRRRRQAGARRDPLRRAGRVRRLAARGDAERRSTAPARPIGCARRSTSSRRAPNVRLMPRTQAFGYYAQNFVGARRDRLRRRAQGQRRRAARTIVAGARQARWCSPAARSSGRWCFPTTTAPA